KKGERYSVHPDMETSALISGGRKDGRPLEEASTVFLQVARLFRPRYHCKCKPNYLQFQDYPP
ncbi:MAG TPA: hypothetical protein PLM41_21495, partial [Saprospiraceae bacterium]|nr:hypothetical protein [Saprospiraceae bacterium]